VTRMGRTPRRGGGSSPTTWRHSPLLAALALALLLAGCSAEPGDGSARAGSKPPVSTGDFTLPDLAGNPVHLADFRGKIVIVDFWATWCPPCIFQVPELNRFWAAHKDAGDVMVIGVAVDVEGAEIVSPWAEEQGVAYPLVIGSEEVARDFGAVGFPTLVIMKPDGQIDSLHVGLIESDELEALVAAIQGASST
jgi:thiol-disulfide isomerase/thioredoxin